MKIPGIAKKGEYWEMSGWSGCWPQTCPIAAQRAGHKVGWLLSASVVISGIQNCCLVIHPGQAWGWLSVGRDTCVAVQPKALKVRPWG